MGDMSAYRLTAATLEPGMPRPDILEQVEFFRLDASRKRNETRKAALGQYFTPAPIARMMASMLAGNPSEVRILDAGAGIGTLLAAAVDHFLRQPCPPAAIHVTACEIDELFLPYLSDTLNLCQKQCETAGVNFSGEILNQDFISIAVDSLRPNLFSDRSRLAVNCAILNPPYRKIHSNSTSRRLLRQVGIETSNLYSAFLALSVLLLDQGGELVAITPRSFCNGPYFRSFRKAFLEAMSLRRLHVFESRQEAFSEDDVLQENVIIHAVKGCDPTDVIVSSSLGVDDDLTAVRQVSFTDVVRPHDPQSFIHIIPDALSIQVLEQMKRFEFSLSDLDLTVSTGRVVDFRARSLLRAQPVDGTVPLIYPTHFEHGYIVWPKQQARKPNALVRSDLSESLLVPNENYVLVKRFSAKEEKKRLVAAVYDASRIKADAVGFENHLNYFHQHGKGLSLDLARGLAAYLNSSLVDWYFRLFNGHTQVNATDLRNLKYPSKEDLERLGRSIGDQFPSQGDLDTLVEKELLTLPEESTDIDPIKIRRRIDEAKGILKALGFPPAQQNDRSALTLLALLDLRPEDPWTEAKNPLRGITPMMEFFATHYGKRYAPNTRETVRRQTIHQFLEAGLVVLNPDNPERPINSGKTVYQIDGMALELLRTFGTPDWDHNLRSYLASVETLKRRYAREREMKRIPVETAPGVTVQLSPGGQNILIREIIENFAPYFTPGGRVLYIGDADEKFAYFDQEGLESLGVHVSAHGKMPDVIIYHKTKDWLVIVEAVTTHGPVDPKRRSELERLFAGCTAGLVFVTAFLDRRTLAQYLDEISWETDVWVAEHPTHLIHFNGERFLGPS